MSHQDLRINLPKQKRILSNGNQTSPTNLQATFKQKQMSNNIIYQRRHHSRMYINNYQKVQQWSVNSLKALLMYQIHLNVKRQFLGKRLEKEMNSHNSVILPSYQNILIKKDSKKLDLLHQQITLQILDHLLINIYKPLILKKKELEYLQMILRLEGCLVKGNSGRFWWRGIKKMDF